MRMLKLLAVSALLYASQAMAYFYVDDTTDSPTFNRPLADLSDLSAIGSDNPYDTFSFSVDAAGSYQFLSFTGGEWDNFLILYSSFDPAAALDGALIANDDLNANRGRSGFSFDLQTGVAYTLVTTGFAPEDYGVYLNIIRGPGELTAPVPEPGTYAMMLCGIAAMGFMARRRRI